MLFGQILRYLSVGILNTFLGISVIWSLMLSGLGPLAANAAGYAVGMVLAFFLNRAWTFRVSTQRGQALRYALAFIVSYGINFAVLNLLLSISDAEGYVAQLFSIAAYSTTFFLFSKYYVFRD